VIQRGARAKVPRPFKLNNAFGQAFEPLDAFWPKLAIDLS
jgi:hypothetical protein